MKKLLSLILLFSTFAGAQVYQTFSMHLVRIEGDLEAFEKVQTMYMQKVAQEAVEKGDIAFWAFLKRFTLDGIDDEKRKNYLFVQSNTDITAMLSDKNSWWSNAKNVLSKEEMDMVSALRKSYTWVEDSRHIFVDEVSIAKGLGSYIQFNFARPKNVNGFISENKSLWKNFFSANMDKMNMVNWGVGRRIAPISQQWSTVVTWDMFKTIEDLMRYRVGEGPNPPSSKSKMRIYNPDGFRSQPIFEPLIFAVKQ
jgi:hypothetical protein